MRSKGGGAQPVAIVMFFPSPPNAQVGPIHSGGFVGGTISQTKEIDEHLMQGFLSGSPTSLESLSA